MDAWMIAATFRRRNSLRPVMNYARLSNSYVSLTFFIPHPYHWFSWKFLTYIINLTSLMFRFSTHFQYSVLNLSCRKENPLCLVYSSVHVPSLFCHFKRDYTRNDSMLDQETVWQILKPLNIWHKKWGILIHVAHGGESKFSGNCKKLKSGFTPGIRNT